MNRIYIYCQALDSKDYFLWGSTTGYDSYGLVESVIMGYLVTFDASFHPVFRSRIFVVELPAIVKAPAFMFGKEVQS